MKRKVRCMLLVAVIALASGAGAVGAQPIDLYEPSTWDRPMLIAHRGGVVTPEASENSAAALRLAAEHGFSMIEVDVRESRDHVPVTFHDRDMADDTGVEARIEELTLEQIKAVRYRETGQEILTLDEALALCAQLDLGVMLDIKTDGSESFFRTIAALLDAHGLTRSAMTFTDNPLAIRHLEGRAMPAVTPAEEERVAKGEAVPLEGTFWFGLPGQIDREMVVRLQELGAVVVPAINVLRYPDGEHMEPARADAVRMQAAGVDAYQIDSVYLDFFRPQGEGAPGSY